ncbi:MAG: methionine--tRNA ligase [Candidatus Krumholzibacteria bacterium]|nr:methionine--tRNA ligase [Candidatus Krumholzibacteria bacterium]
MSGKFKRTLVTSALPYANGEIHLGHLAGAYLPADIYVRYLRLLGEEVLYICGSDEYGVPITLTAEKLGLSPKELVDRNFDSISKSCAGFGMSFDNFSQTSRKIHTETSQAFFTDMHARGVFKQKTTDQFYSPSQDRFLADRYIEGTCPVCGNENARGDECENCTSTYNPTELINPRSVQDNSPLELRPTTHWFLPMGDWQDKLSAYIDSHPEWKDNVKQYCRGYFEAGLRDRAVTRDLAWGVPVPLDDHEGKVFYVWFDAPIGYVSSTREWAIEKGDPEAWRQWWQSDETRLIHFIGKDNIFFHAMMFPAVTMAHSEDYIQADNVPANEFLNLEGRKLSTSKGFAVWLPEYLEKFAADPLRYALARNLPETRDTNFTWEGFQARNNNELADKFGNLIHRTFSFIHKYFDGQVPQWSEEDLTELDRTALAEVAADLEKWSGHLAKFEIRAALEAAFHASQVGNGYFNESAPFSTRKTDMKRCGQSLGVSIQILRQICLMMAPVVPFGMEKLWQWLGMETELWQGGWVEGRQDIPGGRPLGKPVVLFPKFDDEMIQPEIDRLQGMLGND